jgi:hypothetical protein
VVGGHVVDLKRIFQISVPFSGQLLQVLKQERELKLEGLSKSFD